MVSLINLLQSRKESVCKRWLDGIMNDYAPEAGKFFIKGKDRFANPVGHALRVGTQAVLDNLLSGFDNEVIASSLQEIIKIRTVQEFTASQAVSFVFRLKKAVREELEKEPGFSEFHDELERFDADVDRAALVAFDIYMSCRGQICELRVNEIKRSVAAVMERFSRGNVEPVSIRDNMVTTKSTHTFEQRGGDR